MKVDSYAFAFARASPVWRLRAVADRQCGAGPRQSYIIDSFMAVVLGGWGSWPAPSSARSAGLINKFIEPFYGAVLAKIFVLVLIVLFIQKRPQGLFALKGRSAEA
ncbi:hypothetical protein CJO79_06265 [Ralstonia solanacearum]|nr:hypothetical protein CJO79_06265 [Ralstonia solanacearum]